MTRRPRILVAAFAFSAILAGVIPTCAQTTAADYVKLGNQHFYNAEWDQAISSFQTALKLDPTNSDAQLLLSLCYLLGGKPDLARAEAIKYESMKPNDPGGYVAQSQAASALKLYAEAVQAAQTAIRLRPDKTNLAAAYFQLGYNEYMLGKKQEADQVYQTLKTIDTDSAQSLYQAIQRLEAEKKPKPADPPISAAPATAPAAKLPDLPDLPAARTAIQAANILGADDLTLTDVIFILQYRDASVTNQNAAKKVWSEVLAKEKDGQLLQISNALVISSTKTTVDLALSDDCKHSKTADTHLVLSKPLSAPARAGLVTNISGEITSYKVNPIMLTIEHGQLLATAGAPAKTPSAAVSAHTAQPKPTPAAAPAITAAASATSAAATAPSSPADNWILYTNPNGNFASRMPGQPKDTINPTGSDQVSHTLQASADGNAYTVVYVHNQSEQTVDAATYTLFRDNFMKGMPTCQMITEGDPSPAVRGYVGHSYRLNCVFSGTKVTIIGDLYWGRHFAYAVMAVFPTATFDPPFAKTFVDSFSLVDPTK